MPTHLTYKFPIVPTIPTDSKHAVNKEYVDNLVDSAGEPFVTKWNVLANDEIILPIGTEGINNVQVDWGDGTVNFEHSHIYNTAGVKTISITGRLEDFRFNDINTSRLKIIEIVQWGDIVWKEINFYGCTNLTTIPSNESPNFLNCISLESLFRATALTNAYKATFKNIQNVVNLNLAFITTPIAIIEAGILDNAINLVTAEHLFRGTNITSLPSGLFKNSLNLNSAFALVMDTPIESVPEDLFVGAIGLRKAGAMFRETELTTIPVKLFWSCVNLSDVNQMFYGSQVTSLDKDIFKYSRKIENFEEFCRQTPEWTEDVPPLWLEFPDASAEQAFTLSTFPNIEEIPEVWGGNEGTPMPPQKPVGNRDYWNTATEQLQLLIDGEWKNVGGGSTTKPPVDETYADVAALLADQNNQEQDYFYEVTDASGLTAVSSGAAVLLYNASTPTGTESDYIIIWSENEVLSITNITEIPNRSYNDLQDLPDTETTATLSRTEFESDDVGKFSIIDGNMTIPDVFQEGDILKGYIDLVNWQDTITITAVNTGFEAEGVFVNSTNIKFLGRGYFYLRKLSTGVWFASGDILKRYIAIEDDAGVAKKIQVISGVIDISDL